MLRFLNHRTIFLLRKEWAKLWCDLTRRDLCRCAMLYKIHDFFNFCETSVIFLFQILCPCIGDDVYLLTKIIKSDHLVKQHKVDILKPFLIVGIQIKLWFAVLNIIIRKVSDQSSGKAWKIFYFWTGVFFQDLLDLCSRMSYRLFCSFFAPTFTYTHFTVHTGDL